MARAPRTRSKKQPDRIQARHFHLTYAALYDGELNFEQLLAAAREWASTRKGLLRLASPLRVHAARTFALSTREACLRYEKYGTKAVKQKGNSF